MTLSSDLSRAVAPLGMEGNLGILYVCGELTDGKIAIVDKLLGRKVRGICGAYDRLVSLVDAWELEWTIDTDKEEESIESQLVAEGLQDVKIHHVAVGKSHRVAISLDGQLFSWGRPGTVLPSSELGHRFGTSNAQNYYRVKTPEPEVENRKKRTKSAPSSQKPTSTSTVTATGTPHRVVAASQLFFTHVSCGQHHSAAVTDTGDIYTWGRNFEGQLGHQFKTLPKQVNAVVNGICAWPKYVGFFLGKPRVVSVCCGNTFTAVLLADGSVYLLGGGSLRPESKNSQSSFNHLILEKGNNGEPFVAVASGYEHILAVTSAGELFSWGLNTFGQLGHGGKTGMGETEVKGGKALPATVKCEDSIHWTNIFAGGRYSAAISSENQLFTWGNGSFGKLGHGKSSGNSPNCEFVPRCVTYLQNTVVGSVVCADRNLFAFAPTQISGISPLCGEHTGGYELRIKGSGFWSSDNVTVRFVPLTDGRLLRGTLGTFCEATGEVVCQTPKFRLSGEYAVEVSMNGKHFTANGKVFTVFKRPQIAAVSVYDVRFDGGEEFTVSLCGNLPEICRRPIVRFIRCRIDVASGQLVAVDTESEVAVGAFDERPEIVDEEEEEQVEYDPSDITDRFLRLTTPALPSQGEGIAPFTLEISYDGGRSFVPVCVDPTLESQKHGDDEDDNFVDHLRKSEGLISASHVLWVHDAQLVRVSPNSFLTSDLPVTITLELQNLLPPEVTQLLVEVEVDLKTTNASTTLAIERIEGNFLTCKLPPLVQWKSSPKVPNPPAEWWKPYVKTGFMAQMRVSMNAGRTFLPAQLQLGGRSTSTAAEIYGFQAPGRLLSVFPSVGMVPGGTQVSIAGDFFHFDTQDAVVKLQWRERSMVIPGVCLQPEESISTGDISRRVVFRTPPLPFPEDTATATAMAEGMILGTREDIQIFVSLDGQHFTDSGLSFVYCAVPELIGISSPEAEPGTKMILTVDKAIATPAACVKLEVKESGISLVVPVEIDETTHTAEFTLPNLPITMEESVQVLLSLNGQEFTGGAPNSTEGVEISFRYKVAAAE
ncbi:putative E3 ubiquitin-protein ligase HERC4 [Phytophthora citrophthora]|uniref:E3 ubiquitin-protein ligase HERC4 n=1 Tax=Phytophthora citrophthora TaxID=4793 RepID=A0AAD9LDZ5_9STRA|nr:putative E3 ubiquitin-protein ligase HERC4 [Phytophthora citrophthora]